MAVKYWRQIYLAQSIINMTTIAIGKFYTSKDLGYYSRGQQFASLPSTAIIDTIGRVTFPILAKI